MPLSSQLISYYNDEELQVIADRAFAEVDAYWQMFKLPCVGGRVRSVMGKRQRAVYRQAIALDKRLIRIPGRAFSHYYVPKEAWDAMGPINHEKLRQWVLEQKPGRKTKIEDVPRLGPIVRGKTFADFE